MQVNGVPATHPLVQPHRPIIAFLNFTKPYHVSTVMLYNLPYLSNSELFYLFVSRSKRFIETLNANVTAVKRRQPPASLSSLESQCHTEFPRIRPYFSRDRASPERHWRFAGKHARHLADFGLIHITSRILMVRFLLNSLVFHNN